MFRFLKSMQREKLNNRVIENKGNITFLALAKLLEDDKTIELDMQKYIQVLNDGYHIK